MSGVDNYMDRERPVKEGDMPKDHDDKAYTLPAADATAKEWGRLAVSIPGWRWMPGMREGRTGERYEDGDGPWEINKWPDPDDPATAGCLLALLAPRGVYIVPCDQRKGWWRAIIPAGGWPESAPTLGRACIAAAAALGRWPGGEG